jgi:hypothetical protein
MGLGSIELASLIEPDSADKPDSEKMQVFFAPPRSFEKRKIRAKKEFSV